MMTFREWRSWIREYPWPLRWMIYLVLLRPVIDTTWTFKDISPFISPLYIVGVLSPILGLLAVLMIRRPPRSGIDVTWGIWSLITTFGALMVLDCIPTMDGLGITLTMLLPVYTYFVLRRMIRDRRDLTGILQTALISFAVPAALFLKSLVFGSAGIQISRGLTRIHGVYADVTNFGVYALIGFVAAAYFAMIARRRRRSGAAATSRVSANVLLAVVMSLTVVVLMNINHMSSYGVFGAILILLVLLNLRPEHAGRFALILVLGGTLYFVARDSIHADVMTLAGGEIEVLTGERDESRAFHGRFARWERDFNEFIEEPLYANLFGMSLSGSPSVARMVTKGAHSDYLRILFATGFVGLVVYLIIIGQLLVRGLKIPMEERFVLYSFVAMLLLYGITITPTLFFHLMPIAAASLAHASAGEHARMPALSISTPRMVPGAPYPR